MATRKPPPTPQTTEMTEEQLIRGIARLKRALEAVEALDPQNLDQNDPYGYKRPIETKVRTALDETFPQGSIENNRYWHAARLEWSQYVGREAPHHQKIKELTESRQRSIQLLTGAIELLTERLEELRTTTVGLPIAKPIGGKSNKVFVVHGHDEGAKEAVARFISKLGLEPVILHEQPNKGRTIIQKFRDIAAESGFAVVVMTPDDEVVGGKKRARQNVILELGFFLGSLGPSHVAALVKGEVETPSDFDGVVYTAIDEPGMWRLLLAKELRAAGYDVDLNKAIA